MVNAYDEAVGTTTDPRRARARVALEGLATGDALGQRFFGLAADVLPRIARRELPTGDWRWTDDTLMACSVVDTLERHERIVEQPLFASFVGRFEDGRGYGPAAFDLLANARAGLADHRSAAALFDGAGSFGNGAAMRVAPVGAWHANDLDLVAEDADRSAVVTHTHREGRAGAVAVAVAAAIATRMRESRVVAPDPRRFLTDVADRTPESFTRDGIRRAASFAAGTEAEAAAALLGSGQDVAAHDTVPFALWACAHHLASYEDAFWATVAGLGDRDTTCAISCGIVACFVGSVPAPWVEAREPLPAWLGP